MAYSPLSRHIHLLEIRFSAYRRNMVIAGTAFFIALLGGFTLGMLEMLGNQRSILLSGLILALLGLSFITALVRYEVVKSGLELAQALPAPEQMV